MHRKNFLKTCGVFCLGGTTLAAILESCGTSQYYAQSTLSDNKLTIRKSEFTGTKNEKTFQRKFILVKTEKLEFPVCIYRQNETEYTALYMLCTHRGCELKTNGDYIVCPCHGSEFSNKGIVQNPPAENNLKQFPITVDNENIYVSL